MIVALASIIEGHWRIGILLLFMIGFNPYNFYAFFYGAPVYGDISVFPYLGSLIGAYVRLLVVVCSFYTLIIYPVFYMCAGAIFVYKLVIFDYYYYFLRILVASQSDMNGVFNIMSHPKTRFSGVD